MADDRRAGAGRRWRRWRWARRVSQGAFLLLFLWLIGATISLTGGSLDAEAGDAVPYPVALFLQLDPFAGLLVLLADFALPVGMLLGLIVLVSGFFLGRGFCGWVCPLGTLNHLVGEVRPSIRGGQRVRANASGSYQRIKYIVLAVALGAALFGSAVGGLLDPICLVTRGIALTVVPVVEWGLGAVLDGAYSSDIPFLATMADGVHSVTGKALLQGTGTFVNGGVLLALLFLAVLAVNRVVPRFWCRALCPLGALLGASGRFGLLTLKKDSSTCTECKKCQLACQGAASPMPGDRWRRAECDLCLNCVAACPESGSLDFALSGYRTDEVPGPNLHRRHLLAGAAAGAILVPVVRVGSLGSAEGRPDPRRIRPPGSLAENDFLNRCIRCGQCMKICPNNALHPAVAEAGVEGLWTPVLIPRIGYCEPTCTLCTEVCPTGAIRGLTPKEKTAEGRGKIGTAFIDRGRCLPWAMDTPCIVCEEFCPTSPKAIQVSETDVVVDGEQRHLKRPVIRADLCTGCGACEHICPVHDTAAIRVSSVGEARDPENRLLQDKEAPAG